MRNITTMKYYSLNFSQDDMFQRLLIKRKYSTMSWQQICRFSRGYNNEYLDVFAKLDDESINVNFATIY